MADTSDNLLKAMILSGKNNHDWRTTTPELRRQLEETDQWEVRVVEEAEVFQISQLGTYDLIVDNFNDNQPISEASRQGLLDYVSQGGGYVVIHAANNKWNEWTEYTQLIGGIWTTGSSHPAYQEYEVIIDDSDHPITQGLSDFVITDEMYCRLVFTPDIHLLAHSVGVDKFAGEHEPMAWTKEWGQGRMFQLALGHDVPAMQNEGFRHLFLRGCLWAAGKV